MILKSIRGVQADRRDSLYALTGGVGKSCLTGPFQISYVPSPSFEANRLMYSIAQFVQNVWIESYDPTIEDSYRKQIEVDVSCLQSAGQCSSLITLCRGDNVCWKCECVGGPDMA